MLGSRQFLKIKQEVPNLLKDTVLSILLRLRKINANARCYPDFFLAGVQKGGTTSAFNYLIQHPQIIPPLKKAPQYYGVHWQESLEYYKAYFSTSTKKERLIDRTKKIHLTGEGTPNYIYTTTCIDKIQKVNPNAKIIFLLRNPVKRAISDHNYGIKRNAKNAVSKSLNDRLLDELQYLKKQDLDNFYKEDNIVDIIKKNAALLAPGLYYYQLKYWFDKFPKDQLLVLRSEDFFKDQNVVMNKIFDFLNIEPYQLNYYDIFNSNTGFKQKPNEQILEKVQNFFDSHNRRLYQLIDIDMNWN